jgi:hypothetical protein
MNIRKLLSWRRLLIMTHRWTAIAGSLLFLSWFISGIVYAYWEMPGFTSEERLRHLAPLNLSTARVSPIDAAAAAEVQPNRLRIAMYYDGRPVYRFQGNVIVYADTGEPVAGRNRQQAVEFVRQLEPEQATTVRYDTLMEDVDMWTAGGGAGAQMPLHKIAVGDAADLSTTFPKRRASP